MQQPRTNHSIRAKELRLIGSKGENLGVMSLEDALKVAEEEGLDVIEISPNAKPPVARIANFGKFLYEENKKHKEARGKSHSVEVKTIQVKLGTGDHDLALKAKKTSDWLKGGDRVKVDLFLPGRTKYLDENFLKERIERMLKLVTVEYKVANPPKKSPKGFTLIIERA